MLRSMYDQATLGAIAAGGVLGASMRWVATRPNGSGPVEGGWFVYAPNTSVTLGTDVSGFGPVRSSETFATAAGVPLDTLLVNAVGCLLLGVFTVLLLQTAGPTRRLLVGAATGLCGSLTTFSTFAVEVAVLLRGRPIVPRSAEGLNFRSQPATSAAIVYLVVSLAAGAASFWLGRIIAKRSVLAPGDMTSGGE